MLFGVVLPRRSLTCFGDKNTPDVEVCWNSRGQDSQEWHRCVRIDGLLSGTEETRLKTPTPSPLCSRRLSLEKQKRRDCTTTEFMRPLLTWKLGDARGSIPLLRGICFVRMYFSCRSRGLEHKDVGSIAIRDVDAHRIEQHSRDASSTSSDVLPKLEGSRGHDYDALESSQAPLTVPAANHRKVSLHC